MQNSEKLSCLPIAYREPAPVRGGGTTCNKDFIPRALSTVSRMVVGPDVRSRWFLTFLTAQGRFVGLPPFDIPILRVRGHVLY